MSAHIGDVPSVIILHVDVVAPNAGQLHQNAIAEDGGTNFKEDLG